MMPGDIRMLELVQQLTSERSRTNEDHILLTLLWHLFRHEIDAGEMRVIDRQAVVALDLNPIDLPVGGNPKGGNGQGDGQEDNPEESHAPHLIKNRAGTEAVSAISQSELTKYMGEI